MCLQIIQEFDNKSQINAYKPLIAKKDIKVYKVLEYGSDPKNKTNKEKLYSPYRGFIYEKGTHYTESKLKRVIALSFWNDKYNLHIENGLHAYVDKKCKQIENHLRMYKYAKPVVIEMYIPKGSEYYLGNNNDIVTNNLIWY